MNDIADDEPPPRKKRGCFKSCFTALLVLLVVISLLVWGGRAVVRRQGERQLQAVTRQLDADEPGWKLDDLESARRQKMPPAGESSAPVILDIADKLPQEWRKWWQTAEWGNTPSNHLMPEARVAEGKAHAAATLAVRTSAARLRDLTPGGFEVKHADNPVSTLLPHIQKSRDALSLLQYDALLAAATGSPDVAIRDAHACVNVARAIGEEPTLISQLVRLAAGRVGSQVAVQAMAWGEPKAGLVELQAAFWAEAEEPKLLYGLRGERAAFNKLFEGLQSGRITTKELIQMIDNQSPNVWQSGVFRLYKAMLPGDHAEGLRVVGEYIAAAKLPPHEQLAALKAVKMPPRPPDDFRYIFTAMLMPACEKVAEATIRCRAELYAASVAIACERFRQKTGKWPASLAEIPKDILPAIPTDPFNGEPMRMQRMPDGVAVYSVGPPETPQTRNAKKTGPVDGDGLGWRLYDLDKRRLPPKPEPKVDDPNAPPEEAKKP